MTITKKSCKNFKEIQKRNRNDIGGSLAGFSSHNYSPAGNTPSHQLNTTLSVAKNTNRQINTNKNKHWDTNTIVHNLYRGSSHVMILSSKWCGREEMANGNHYIWVDSWLRGGKPIINDDKW